MTTETSWAEKIGAPAASGIRDMVAALECDYERLNELRDDKASWEADNEPYNADDAEELAALEAEAGDCKDQDEARERIGEDALSVEVRSGWVTPGDPMPAADFAILLATGGPAVRIRGELDADGVPHRAWLEVQDWGKPWTEYFEPDLADSLLAYAQCFSFGPG